MTNVQTFAIYHSQLLFSFVIGIMLYGVNNLHNNVLLICCPINETVTGVLDDCVFISRLLCQFTGYTFSQPNEWHLIYRMKQCEGTITSTYCVEACCVTNKIFYYIKDPSFPTSISNIPVSEIHAHFVGSGF